MTHDLGIAPAETDHVGFAPTPSQSGRVLRAPCTPDDGYVLRSRQIVAQVLGFTEIKGPCTTRQGLLSARGWRPYLLPNRSAELRHGPLAVCPYHYHWIWEF